MTPTILISGITPSAAFVIGANTLTYTLTVNNTIVPVVGGVETLKFIVKITSPSGFVIYKNTGWDTGDFTSPDSQTGTYSLPVVSGTLTPEAGVYIIQYQAQYVVLVGPTTTLSGIVAYNCEKLCITCMPKAAITPTLNCTTATLFIQDTTNYDLDGYSLVSTTENWTITPPVASGQSPQTGTGSEITVVNGVLYNGTYQIALTSVAVYVKGNTTITVNLSLTLTKYVVSCVNPLCAMVCVLTKLKNEYIAAAGTSAAPLIQNRLTLGDIMYTLAKGAIDCGSDYNQFVSAFWTVTQEDQNCSCCTDSATGLVVGIGAPTQGPAGPIGPAGSTGASGAAGTPGAVWRVGSGAPSNGLGINGDFYLDSATGNVYQKASGTYSIVANIEGAAGTNGTTRLWNPFVGYTNTGGAGDHLDYTIPGSALAVVGDTVDLLYEFASTQPMSALDAVLLKVGGNPVAAVFYGASTFFQTVRMVITLVDSTHVRVDCQSTVFQASSGTQIYSQILATQTLSHPANAALVLRTDFNALTGSAGYITFNELLALSYK